MIQSNTRTLFISGKRSWPVCYLAMLLLFFVCTDAHSRGIPGSAVSAFAGPVRDCDDPPGPAVILTPSGVYCGATDMDILAADEYAGAGQWTVISGPGVVADPAVRATVINGLEAGQTTVLRWTVSNGNVDCEDVFDELTIIAGDPAPVIDANLPVCTGSDLIMTVSGNDIASVTWFDLSNNPVSHDLTWILEDIGPDDIGVYRVEVEDIHGCMGIAYRGVEIGEADVADAGSDQLLCEENAYSLNGNMPQFGPGIWTLLSGSATIHDPSDPNTFVSDLGVGENVFVWTITPENGCPETSDTVKVTVGNAHPEIISNAPVCEGGTLIFELLGGPYVSYEWQDPDYNVVGTGETLEIQDVTQDMTGVYSVTIIDEYGCTGYASRGVEIYQADVADAGADQLLCEENAYSLNGNIPQFGPGVWTLLSGSAMIDDPSDPNTFVSDLGVGENVFVWTITPENGCPETSDTVTVTVGNAHPEIISNAPLCEGGTLIFELLGGPYVSYEWRDPDYNTISTDATLELPGVTQDMTGVYSVTIVDEYGCMGYASRGIEIYQADVADAGADRLLCEENAYSLNGSTPQFGPGVWTLLSGSATIDDPSDPNTFVSDLGVGENVFVWTITLENGCPETSDTVTITVGNVHPVITSNAPLCEGGTLILELLGGPYVSYEWRDPDYNVVGTGETLEVPDVTQDMTGVYSVTIVDEYGCTGYASRGVEIYQADVADAGVDQLLCEENGYSLNGNIPQFGPGVWTLLSGSATIDDPSDPNTFVSDLGVGENVFVWTIMPENGCPETSDTVKVTVGNAHPMITSNAPLCEGETLILELLGGPYVSYEWQDPSYNLVGTGETLEIPDVTQDMTGVYSVTIIDEYGCTGYASRGVEIYQADVADAGADQLLCEENAYSLNGNMPQFGPGLWTLLSGSATIDDPSDPNTFVSDLGVGENVFVWTIMPENGCPETSDTVTVTVTVGNAHPEIISNAPLCEGGTLIFELVGGPYVSYEWQDPDYNVVGTGETLEIQDVIQDMTGVYSVTIIDEYGCTGYASRGVEIYQADVADAGADQLLCEENAYSLNGNMPQFGPGVWTLLSGSATIHDPSDPNTFVSDLGVGENVFVWTIMPENGCPETSDTVKVTVGNAHPMITSNAPLCEGETLELSLAGGIDFVAYQWFDPGYNQVGTDETLQIANVTADMSGIYAILVLDAYGCEGFATIEITIDAPQSAAAGPDQLVCGTYETVLDANAPVIGTGTWTVLSGTAVFADANDPGTSVSGLSLGENVLVWTLDPDNTCGPSNDEVVITIGDPAPVITGNLPVCEGGDLELSVSGTDLTGADWYDPQGDPVGSGLSIVLSGVSPVDDGLYRVDVTDSYGCTAEATIDVMIDAAQSAAAGPDQLICGTYETVLDANAPVIGTGTWTVLSGTAVFADANDPGTSVSGLSLGENVLVWTLDPGNACGPSNDEVVITVGYPAPMITGNLPVCQGSDLELMVSGVGLTGADWYDPQGDPVGSGLSIVLSGVSPVDDGLYRVDVTDSYGCTAEATIDITIDAANVAAAGPDQLICGTYETVLDANAPVIGTGTWTVLSGTAVFADANDPGTSVSGLSLGENVLVWTLDPGNACGPSNDEVVITVGYPAPMITGNLPVCQGSDLELMVSGVGLTGADWYDPQGDPVGSGLSIVLSGVSPVDDGLYRVDVTDSYGCTAEATIDITIDAANVAAAGPDQLICGTYETVLDANTPVIGTGTWTVLSGTAVFADANDPGTSVSGLSLGENVLVWTLDPGNACGPGSDEVVITVGDPAPVITGNLPVCEGSDLELMVSGTDLSGADWYDPQGDHVGNGFSITLTGMSPADDGIYLVEVTDSYGCTAEATIDITIDAAQVAAAGPDQLVCGTYETVLDANAPLIGTGTWTVLSGMAVFADANDPGTSVSGLSLGENVLVWTLDPGNACGPSNDEVVITIGDPAPMITGNLPVCEGGDLELMVSGTDLSGADWYDPQGDPVGNGFSITLTGMSPADDGIYLVEVTDSYGCTAEATIDVTIDAANVAAAGPDQLICGTYETVFDANAPVIGTGTWTVLSGTAVFADANDPGTSVSGLSLGENVLVWTLDPGNACGPSNDEVVITVGDPAPVITGNLPVCQGSDLELMVSGTDLTGADWYDPQGDPVGSGLSIVLSGVSPADDGIYLVEVTDSYGCTAEATIDVTIDAADVAAAGPDQLICGTYETVLNANTPVIGTGGWTVLSGTAVFANANDPGTSVSGLSLGENVLVWTLDPGNACGPGSDEVVITVGDPAPVITGNLPVCEGSDLELMVSGTDLSGADWYDPQGDPVGNGLSITLTGMSPADDGIYLVEVTDSYGCTAEATIDVMIDAAQAADSGPDQLVCVAYETVLGANTPVIGTGTWKVLSGTAVFADANDPGTSVSGLSLGENVLVWTLDPGNACGPSNDEVVITVGDPAPQIGSNAPLCAGGTLVIMGQGAGIQAYDWTGPQGHTYSGEEIELTGASADDSGTYQLTVTDIYGCVATQHIEISVEPVPQADAGIDQLLCTQTNTVLQANLPVGTEGIWTILAGSGLIADPSAPDTEITGLDPATGAVLQWMLTSGIAGCTSTDTMVINYTPPTPPAYAGEDMSVCLSAPVLTLSAHAPADGFGEWQIIEGMAILADVSDPGTEVHDFSAGPSGTLILRWSITDICHQGHETAEDDIVITLYEIPGPATILTEDARVCDQTELALIADSDYTGQGVWSILSGSGVIADPVSPITEIRDLIPGSHVLVQWAVSNGVCPSVSTTVEISVDVAPDLSYAGADIQLCDADIVYLSANPVANGIGTWHIIGGDALLADNADPQSALTGLTAGEAVLLVWEISSGACPSSVDTLEVRIDAMPTAALAGEDRQWCDAGQVNLEANTPVTGTGIWTLLAGQAVLVDPASPVSELGLQAYDEMVTLSWTISNGVCPSSADTVTVISHALPDAADAGEDILACVQEVTLAAVGVGSGTGVWRIESGTAIIADTSLHTSLLSGLVNNETVVLSWTVSNGNCPVNVDLVSVTVANNYLQAMAGDDLAPCSVETILLAAEPAPEGASGYWEILSGPGAVADISDPASLLTGLAPGRQTVLVWTLSEGACPDVSDTLVINNLDGADISANFLVNESPCVGDSIAIIDVSDFPEDADVVFLWTSGGVGFSTERDPVVVFEQSGPQQIQLEIRVGECINLSPAKDIYVFDCLPGERDSVPEWASVTAYPNPSGGSVWVELEQKDESAEMVVYNSSGQVVHTEVLRGHFVRKELALEEPGLYLIRISGRQYERTLKVLKL